MAFEASCLTPTFRASSKAGLSVFRETHRWTNARRSPFAGAIEHVTIKLNLYREAVTTQSTGLLQPWVTPTK